DVLAVTVAVEVERNLVRPFTKVLEPVGVGPAVDHELGAVRVAVPAEPYRVRLRRAVRADRDDPDHRIVLQSRAYPLSESGCRVGKNIRRHGGQPSVAPRHQPKAPAMAMASE